jgi:hypothetical protein
VADQTADSPLLVAGDRVFVYGGYDQAPKWLGGGMGYSGTIERFIPGQNAELAAVVRTDDAVAAEGVSGSLLVLELRYVGAKWLSGANVHVELCDFEPDAVRWQERRQGKWVESHAAVRRL